jgi:probable phosphoglycerate mutase
MALIHVVRHGESTWNAQRRWAGHADVPLSALGREQALEACGSFAAMNFDGIVSSSLRSAHETAEIVATRLDIPLLPALPEFNERNAGHISGLTSSEIEARFPGLLDDWRQGKIVDIPGGESWDVFMERVLQGFCHIQEFNSERILLVTHEGVLRAVTNHFNEPFQKYANLHGRWVESGVLGLRAGETPDSNPQ